MNKRNWRTRAAVWVLCLGMLATSLPLDILASDIGGEEQKKSADQQVPADQQSTVDQQEPQTQTEIEEPQPAMKQEYKNAVFSIGWSDEGDIAKRRESDIAKLIEVYADGVKLDNSQLSIRQDNTEPEQENSVDIYHYTIENLPVYQEDLTTRIQYTLKENQEALNGYEAVSAQMASPTEELAFTETGDSYQCNKKFGNYLPQFQAEGAVIWRDGGSKAEVHPEIEAYFSEQFVIERNQESYYTYKVTYSQDEEDGNKWNFSIAGLFTVKEDGGAASYTIKAKDVNGCTAAENEATVSQDSKDLVFTYEKKIQTRTSAVMSGAAETNSAAGRAELKVEWIDNQNANNHRPDADTFKDSLIIQYQTNGTWKNLKISDYAGASLTVDESQGVGYYQCTAAGLPEEIGKVTVSAYRIVSGYASEEYEKAADSGLGKEEKYYEVADQVFYLDMKIGTHTPDEMKDTILKTVIVKEDETEIDSSVYSIVSGSGDVLPALVVKKQRIYHDDNTKAVYSATAGAEGKVTLDAGWDGDYLQVEYENSAVHNQGTSTTKAYPGGEIQLTLMGEGKYEAAKKWLDSWGTPDEKQTNRPDVSFYLWRYTDKGGMDFTSAAQVKDKNNQVVEIKLAGADKQKDSFTFNLENYSNLELPKYDAEGYNYIYLTRETLIGDNSGKYEQIFGTVSVKEGVQEITGDVRPYEEGRKDGDMSVYDTGIISNRIKENIPAKLTKTWSAAAYQSQLETVEVVAGLKYREKGTDSWQEFKNADGTAYEEILDNFLAETLTKSIETTLPRYDYLGKEIEYQWVEKDILLNGTTVEPKDGSFALELTNPLTGQPEKIEFQGEPVKTDIIDYCLENKLAGEVDYTVRKIWKIGEDIVNDADYLKDASLTFSVYQDGKLYTENLTSEQLELTASDVVDEIHTEEGSEYNVTWAEKLHFPKYAPDGHEYEYTFAEGKIQNAEVPAGTAGAWDVDGKEYDLENRLVTFRNVIKSEGISFPIQKKWIDGGDQTHRAPVYVNIYHTGKNGAADEYAGTAVLTFRNGWYQEVGIETKNHPEWLEEWKNASNPEFKDFYYLQEVEIDTDNNYSIEQAQKVTGNPQYYSNAEQQYAETGHHYYKVNYDGATVTNRRLGTVSLQADKIWKDGDNTAGRKKVYLQAELVDGEGVAISAIDKTTGRGTVTVEGDKAYNNITLRREIDTSQTSGNYTFANLPKYDKNGSVIHWTIKEVDEEGKDITWTDDYYSAITLGEYQQGSHSSGDIQQISVINGRRGTKDVSFVKKWADKYAYNHGKRPDIYLTLYRRLAADDTSTPEKIMGYPKRDWTYHDDEWWTCTFPGLEKYNEDGVEWIYYATEETASNVEEFDYRGVRYEGDVIKGTGAETKAVLTDVPADAGGNTVLWYLREGQQGDISVGTATSGYFQNQVEKDVIIAGQKVWQDIPSGFPVESYPQIVLGVNQYETDGTGAQTGNPKEVAEIILKADANHTTSVWKYELAADTNGNPLPKYDQNGNLYVYEIAEKSIAGVTGTGINDKKDIIYTEIQPGRLNNDWKVANVYDNGQKNNKASLTVKKEWSGQTGINQIWPKVEFVLTRMYSDGTNTPVDDTEFRQEKTLNSNKYIGDGVKVDDNGKGSLIFENLPVYAPNGSAYQYYVEEQAVEGYKVTGVTIDGVSSGTAAGKAGPIEFSKTAGTASTDKTEASVTYTNAYEAASISLEGQKIWDDFSNKFNIRPEKSDVKLTLQRSAGTQTGQGNQIAWEDVAFGTADTDKNYFSWTAGAAAADKNSWNYTIKNLERYAPNGTAWKYRIEEKYDKTSANQFMEYYDGASQTADQGSVDGTNGNITMKDLTNTSSAKLTAKKAWADIANIEEPEVTVKLQVKKGSSPDWKWADDSTVFTEEVRTVIGDMEKKLNNGNNWTADWSKLPKGTKESGPYVEFQYRVMETMTGAQAVEFDASGLEYAASQTILPYVITTDTASGVSTVTNTLKADSKTSLNVIKTWSGDSDNGFSTRGSVQDGKWEVKFHIYRKAEGSEPPEQLMQADGAKPVILAVTGTDTDRQGSKTLSSLPAVSPTGSRYTYYAAELDANGTEITGDSKYNGSYTVSGSGISTGDSAAGYTTSVTNALDTAELKVTKIWKGNDADFRPETLEMTLLRSTQKTPDGTLMNPEEVSNGAQAKGEWEKAGDTWTCTFRNLPRYDTAGNSYYYTVREQLQEGYRTPAVSGTEGTEEAQAVSVTNQATSFAIDKAGNEESAAISGAKLQILRQNDKTMLKEWVTDGQPHIVEGLPAGEYILHEEEAPDGYLKADDILFTLKADNSITGEDVSGPDGMGNYTITMTDTYIRSSIRLEKRLKDSAQNTSEPLEDAVFELYKGVSSDGTLVAEVTTDKSGVWDSAADNTPRQDEGHTDEMLSKGLEKGTYYFKEKSVPGHVYLEENLTESFTIGKNGEEQAVTMPEVVEIDNKPFKAGLSLKKIDAVSKEVVSDAQFKVSYSEDGNQDYVERPEMAFATDAQGRSTITFDKKGFYRIEERGAKGYHPDSNFSAVIEITNTDDYSRTQNRPIDLTSQMGIDRLKEVKGTITTKGIENERLPGKVTVTKADSVTYEQLQGVKFELRKRKEPDGLFEALKEFFTGKTYTSVEDIEGTDIGGTAGHPVGKLEINGLEWGDYQLVETKAALGYVNKGRIISFTVDRDNLDITLGVDTEKGKLVLNEKNYLTIQKADADQKNLLLDGAKFEVLNEKKQPLDPAVTASAQNGTVQITGKLTGGKNYILREILAPVGYELADDIGFTMKEDGTVIVNETPAVGNIIEVKDKAIEIVIQKVDADDKEPVTRGFAVFSLYEGDKDTAPVKTGLATDKPHGRLVLNKDSIGQLLKINTTYILEEVEAPKGYELAEDISFQIDGKGNVMNLKGVGAISEDDTIRVQDKKITLGLEKQDFVGRQKIDAGKRGEAEFDVTGTFASKTDMVKVTSENMSALDGELIPGYEYTMKETKAPAGYKLAEKFSFEVGTDGTVIRINGGDVQAIADTDKVGAAAAGMDKIIVRDEPVAVTLRKADAAGAGTESIEGSERGMAEFDVTPAAGHVFADGSRKAVKVTSGNVERKLQGLLAAGSTYIFTETKAPEGYELAEPYKITIEADGAIKGQGGSLITIADGMVRLRLVKVDSGDTQKELKGASFAVKPAGESRFATTAAKSITVDDSRPDVLDGELIAGNTYEVTEVKSPDGYELLRETLSFTVQKDGSVKLWDNGSGETAEKDGTVLLKIKNKPLEISFLKRLKGDMVETGIPGAALTISGRFADRSETEISWVTEETARTFKNTFIAGETYTLTETAAPEGALFNPKQTGELFAWTFKVEEDGSVTDISSNLTYERGTVTIWNVPTTLAVFKRGMDNMGSGSDPLLAQCSFDVAGEFAPARYQEGDMAGRKRTALRASAGAAETIRVTTTGTDNGDNALKGRLIVGNTYTIKEVEPPAGYELGMEVTFTVTGTTVKADGTLAPAIELSGESGEKGNSGYWITADADGSPVIMQRDEPLDVKLQKTGEAGSHLSGVEFRIEGTFADQSKDGKTFVTDENGRIDLNKQLLESNNELQAQYIYKLTEIHAKEGYEKLQSSVYFRVVSKAVDEQGNTLPEGSGREAARKARLEILYGENQTVQEYEHILTTEESTKDVEVLTVKNKKIPDIAAPEQGSTSGQNKLLSFINNVRTGDESSVLPYVLLLIAAAAGIVLAVIWKKRKK